MILRLFICGLTGFLSYHLTDKADTLALIRFGLAVRADLVGHLTKELLVDALEGDDRVFTFFGDSLHRDFLRQLENEVVGVTEAETMVAEEFVASVMFSIANWRSS